MRKYIIIIYILLFVANSLHSQDNKYSYKPFPILKAEGQTVIAGDVSTFIYTNYYGKNAKAENYNDPHAKPEYLVYQLFVEIKNKNIDGVAKLYDASFNGKNFDQNNMAEKSRNYTDIKFVSKFKTGDLVIIRYDFVSPDKNFPVFASIRNIKGSYFLTTQINVSDPFNVIGSFSPNNLTQKKEGEVNTKNMVPFYFVEKESKIFFTNQVPNEEHTALYLDFEFYTPLSKSPEADFLKTLQKTAVLDSARLKTLIATEQLPLLSSDIYFGNYFYADIKKMFRNYSIMVPLATLKINDGKILYFRFGSPDETPSHIGSVILKKVNGKYFLGLRISDNNLYNILWNVYIREAIYDYFNKK